MLKASHIFLSRIFLWDFSDHPLRLRKMEFYYLGSVFYSKYLIEGYELKKKKISKTPQDRSLFCLHSTKENMCSSCNEHMRFI